ncbi:DUF3958 family protein [Enterococcus sp. BWM-S5]|uniref:DUF3958 family protein n=1 Tax=Enterococcus larvae TaxID=2794352 RepID=A0ABS4CMZ1_9ENTE|nr:DUF3958 family protein [Enterococcus larvae]MBP1047637.1 DUF3958 family protein [Enterococcus larvae]
MTDKETDKEVQLTGQLRRINEQQEDNQLALRKRNESEDFIHEAYSLEQSFLNDLSAVLHTSNSVQFLQSIEEEHHMCRRQSFTRLEEQLENLQQEKQTLTEKENDLLCERTALLQEEVKADEY